MNKLLLGLSLFLITIIASSTAILAETPTIKFDKVVSWHKFWDYGQSTPFGRKLPLDTVVPYQHFLRQLEDGHTAYGFPEMVWTDNGNGSKSAKLNTKGDANVFILAQRFTFDEDYDGRYIVTLTPNRETIKPYYAILYSELDDEYPQPMFRLCPKPNDNNGWIWNQFILVNPRKGEKLIMVMGEVTKEKITDPNYKWIPEVKVLVEEKKDE